MKGWFQVGNCCGLLLHGSTIPGATASEVPLIIIIIIIIIIDDDIIHKW
jgi:hypothetical protein